MPRDVSAAHPRAGIDDDLRGLQLNRSCLLRGDEAPDLRQRMRIFIAPHYARKAVQPHQQRGKVVGGKGLLVHLVARHDLNPAADAGDGEDGDARLIDGLHIAVDGAGRHLEHRRQLLRADTPFLQQDHDYADKPVHLHEAFSLPEFLILIINCCHEAVNNLR